MKITNGDFTFYYLDENWNENLNQTISWNPVTHTSTYKERAARLIFQVINIVARESYI